MTIKRSAVWLALAAALTATGAFAQAADDDVFAPYPSRIRVGVRGRDVVISWVDSPDIQAGYVVFRNADFPSAENFSGARRLGESESGEKGFVYTADDSAPYYYFVLGKASKADHEGGDAEYRVFIPLRNVVMEPIAVAAEPAAAPVQPAAAASPAAATPSAAPVAPAAPVPTPVAAPTAPAPSPVPAQPTALAPAKPQAEVSGILARADQDAIVVSADAVEGVGRLIIYRSTSPVQRPSSLLDAALAAIVDEGSGPYRDYPVPGVEYFYCVIPEKDLAGGRVTIEPGVNATTTPASISAGAYRVGLPSMQATSRSMPLPYLVLTRGFDDAKPVGIDDPTPSPKALSAETEKAIATLETTFAASSRVERPSLTLFPTDLQAGGGGEGYTLRTIVNGYLAKGDYAEAARQLTLFLSLPRAPANAARARFYRGQAYAMAGSYREAFFDLIQTLDEFYAESSAWMDFILSELHEGNRSRK